jgi:hypothetical protein
MIVSELFSKLSYGQLSSLAIGMDGAGSIAEAGKPAIVHHLNDALSKLYSSFMLKEKDLQLLMEYTITIYHLQPRFAYTYVPTGAITGGRRSDDEYYRYIMDLPTAPFKGDVLKIHAVFDAEGNNIPLNDSADINSVFTPQANVLQVPRPIQSQTLSVLYQAKHIPIIGDLQEQIEIPNVLEEALLSWIAYKVFSAMGTEQSTSKAQEHRAAYDSEIARVIVQDLVGTSVSTSNSRFENRGWV